jgi:hypothetical protein
MPISAQLHESGLFSKWRYSLFYSFGQQQIFRGTWLPKIGRRWLQTLKALLLTWRCQDVNLVADLTGFPRSSHQPL